MKEHPTEGDRAAIQGKFKSYHNVSDNVASPMTKTFYALLALADLRTSLGSHGASALVPAEEQKAHDPPAKPFTRQEWQQPRSPTLHYNIQIHLPATKEVEVYNAIFKSLRAHLIND